MTVIVLITDPLLMRPESDGRAASQAHTKNRCAQVKPMWATPIKMRERPAQGGQDVPTATNAGSTGITQKAVHQMVKIALQQTDWLGIAPLCNSTGQQIGPGLVADLPDLCGL